MGKIIILEGPDGGGKTTLAKYLENLGWEYRHEGPPLTEDQMEYYKCQLYKALDSPTNVVFDRLHLGELVYGPIFRGRDQVGKEGIVLFERIFASRPVLLYICMPKDETLYENYRVKMNDPSDYVKGISNLKKVQEIYYALMGRPHTLVYDYEIHTPESVLEKACDGIFNTGWLSEGTIGSKLAKYLFIGDTPNHPYVDWPFFALNGSSGYMNKAIELCRFEEKDVAFSNAFAPNGKQHDFIEIVKRLPKLKHIFIMGGRAREWYNDHTVECRPVKVHFIEHPSYIKRFRGANPQILASMIQEKMDGHLSSWR